MRMSVTCKVNWHSSRSGRQYLGVALGVPQQTEQETGTLLWPATLACRLALVLGLCSAPNATTKAAERNRSLVCQDVLEILFGFVQLHFADSQGRLSGVLEMHAQIRAFCLQTAETP